MVLTTLEIALLVILTQIPTMLMWFQVKALKEDQIDALRNQRSVVQIQQDLILSERQRSSDLLNRLMSRDLHTYERMTAVTPQLSDSTSSISEPEPRISMSDYSEWARENNVEEQSDEKDFLDLHDDLLGLGQL